MNAQEIAKLLAGSPARQAVNPAPMPFGELAAVRQPQTWARGNILPFERNTTTGDKRWAMPGMIYGAYQGMKLPGQVMRGEVDISSGGGRDYAIDRMADVGGMVTLGAGAMPTPKGPGTVLRMGADDYRGWHKAPGRLDVNASLDDLAKIYPDDIYSNMAARYYGHGDPSIDNETVRIVQAFRGKPDAEVTVYRAVPKGVKDINPGDWVTPNRKYAEMHGSSWVDDGQYEVISRQVKASDLFTDANSIHEFGYDPKNVK
jgi:hypothetical protein